MGKHTLTSKGCFYPEESKGSGKKLSNASIEVPYNPAVTKKSEFSGYRSFLIRELRATVANNVCNVCNESNSKVFCKLYYFKIYRVFK